MRSLKIDPVPVAVGPRELARLIGVSPAKALRMLQEAGATRLGRKTMRLPLSRLPEVLGMELAAEVVEKLTTTTK